MEQTSLSSKLLFFSLIIFIGCFTLPSQARALTISEVVVDLACPCECPLVLEDCNMSCGLKWKNQVGEMINEGKTKQQITDYFVGKYGKAALLTPLQRVHGKIFQYTRSFDTIDWTILWTGIAVWISLMFFGVYIGVRKLFFNSSQSA